MLKNRRTWLILIIGIITVIMVILLGAPASNQSNNGSTYSKNPSGYGAWYKFMSERDTPIQRLEKPLSSLTNNQENYSLITLLQINPRLNNISLSKNQTEWVTKGNNLVILGISKPPTKASFTTLQNSNVGKVKIETTRRAKDREEKTKILADEFGLIVWKEKIGKGEVIFATTPHLAANAYQDIEENYEFLAQILTQYEIPIWVDEYIHGYKDQETIEKETGIKEKIGTEGIFSYLSKTPLFPILIQGIIIILIAIIASNRRFGLPMSLSKPKVDNSQAYIEALAGVLEKANTSEFILSTVGKEEQKLLQQRLGLGKELVNNNLLVEAFKNAGGPTTLLLSLLNKTSKKNSLTNQELLNLLHQWQQIHHRINHESKQ